MTAKSVFEQITIGADPELFLFDRTTHTPRSAIGLVGGTKEVPMPVDKGAVQEDNVMAEFNITPANNFADFSNNIATVRQCLDSIVSAHNCYSAVVPEVTFPKDQLDNQKARESGCDPDFNLYMRNAKDWNSPKYKLNMESVNMRMAGGHIHIGIENFCDFSPTIRTNLIVWCDALIGTILGIFDNSSRQSYYGSFGTYRPKPYGIEYRTPSNIWLGSPVLMEYVFHAAQLAGAMAVHTDTRTNNVLENSFGMSNHNFTHCVIKKSTRYLELVGLTNTHFATMMYEGMQRIQNNMVRNAVLDVFQPNIEELMAKCNTVQGLLKSIFASKNSINTAIAKSGPKKVANLP